MHDHALDPSSQNTQAMNPQNQTFGQHAAALQEGHDQQRGRQRRRDLLIVPGVPLVRGPCPGHVEEVPEVPLDLRAQHALRAPCR